MVKAAHQNLVLQSELRQLFARAKMPTSPALAVQILKLINKPESSKADFAAVIQNDPALSARLLKMANSVHFAQRTPASTIDRAVTVLGLRNVKTTALGFQLVAHVDRLGGTPFDMQTFWQHSLLRACLARSIAHTVVPECEDEAFLVGLLQECGIPLLVQILGCCYASFYRSSRLSPAAFYAVEKESFPHTHVETISVMAFEWNLPEIIAVPLECHHQRTELSSKPSNMEQLSAVSYFTGGLRFSCGVAVHADEQGLRDFGVTALRLDDAAWARAQDRARKEYEEVCGLYEHHLPPNLDITELLNEANRQLVLVAHESNQLLVNVQEERKAILRERQRLANALRDYRERAALDPLTGLVNRGALMDAARQAIRQSLDDGTPVGVLFVDLDNFKLLNDTYGHKAGDDVLRSTAALMTSEVGNAGIVGRYGGEEFVILLRNVSADNARQTAERIVRRIRTLDTNPFGFSCSITCSLGGIWSGYSPAESAEELFAAADQRMYQAKRSGGDRCCFDAFSGPSALGNPHDGRLGDPADAGNQCFTAGLAHLLQIAERLNREEHEGVIGIRKQRRKRIETPCTLRYFTADGTNMRAEIAATRNISTGGIGLLTARMLVRGEAVEVLLNNGRSELYLAGLVAFCRHIEDSIHEVGVQFVSHGVAPIISGNVSAAMKNHDWVARALGEKLGSRITLEKCG